MDMLLPFFSNLKCFRKFVKRDDIQYVSDFMRHVKDKLCEHVYLRKFVTMLYHVSFGNFMTANFPCLFIKALSNLINDHPFLQGLVSTSSKLDWQNMSPFAAHVPFFHSIHNMVIDERQSITQAANTSSQTLSTSYNSAPF